MEDNFDAEELEIVLGLKNKREEINKIISDQNGLSFIGAISKILTGNNSNDLYEEIESEENQNEMFSNFSKQMGIDKIAPIKLTDYENSNFANNIRGEDKISHNPNLNFSNEFLQKLKKDFVIPKVEAKKIKKILKKMKKMKMINIKRIISLKKIIIIMIILIEKIRKIII